MHERPASGHHENESGRGKCLGSLALLLLVLLTGTLYFLSTNDLIFEALTVSESCDDVELGEAGKPTLRHTKVVCHAHGSTCVYTDICFDGKDFVLLVDDSKEAGRKAPLQSPQYIKGNLANNFGSVLYDNPQGLLPRNQAFNLRTLPASLLFGKGSKAVELPLYVDQPIELEKGSPLLSTVVSALADVGVPLPELNHLEYMWLDGAFFPLQVIIAGTVPTHLGPNAGLDPWYWAEAGIPLWLDQRINRSLATTYVNSMFYNINGEQVEKSVIDRPDLLFPPMDYVVLFSDHGPWGREMLKTILPSETRVLKSDVFVAPETDYNTTYVGFGPVKEGRANLGLTPKRRWMCMRKAVLRALQYVLFPDIADWSVFRYQTLHKLGLPELAKQTEIPKAVLFKKSGRVVSNMNELIAVCRKYVVCDMSSDWGDDTPLAVQARESATHAIFVGSHGSDMTNMIFVHPAGAVIELFPYKFWPDMFQRLANEMSVAYFGVASFEPPEDVKKNHPHCLDVTAKTFVDDSCTHQIKDAAFSIPVDKFEYALINALQLIGVNALPSATVSPVPKPAGV